MANELAVQNPLDIQIAQEYDNDPEQVASTSLRQELKNYQQFGKFGVATNSVLQDVLTVLEEKGISAEIATRQIVDAIANDPEFGTDVAQDFLETATKRQKISSELVNAYQTGDFSELQKRGGIGVIAQSQGEGEKKKGLLGRLGFK